MSQKVLVTYGDFDGPRIIGAAEKVLGAAAPDIEVIHGKIGSDAHKHTSYALPPDTVDSLGECNAVLSGPVNMVGIDERNPLEVIKIQTGLLAEYSEVFNLRMGLNDIPLDIGVVNPTVSDILDIQETEDLDGVTSSFYTNTEATVDLFSIVRRITELRGGSRVWLSDEESHFPIRNRIIKKTFHDTFDNTPIISAERTPSEISYHLAHDPESLDMILCGANSAPQIYGYGAGLIGGSGLMPHAFLNKNFGLFVPMSPLPCESRERSGNPTSAILSVAVMLLTLGRKKEYQRIRDAVCEMYRTGHTTHDIGGRLNAAQFADGINDLIYSEKLAG